MKFDQDDGSKIIDYRNYQALQENKGSGEEEHRKVTILRGLALLGILELNAFHVILDRDPDETPVQAYQYVEGTREASKTRFANMGLVKQFLLNISDWHRDIPSTHNRMEGFSVESFDNEGLVVVVEDMYQSYKVWLPSNEDFIDSIVEEAATVHDIDMDVIHDWNAVTLTIFNFFHLPGDEKELTATELFLERGNGNLEVRYVYK